MVPTRCSSEDLRTCIAVTRHSISTPIRFYASASQAVQHASELPPLRRSTGQMKGADMAGSLGHLGRKIPHWSKARPGDGLCKFLLSNMWAVLGCVV